MATQRKTDAPAIGAEILTEPTGTPYGLRLTFSDGDTLSITAGQLSADLRAYALIHGLKQKLVDAAAISRDPDTGRAATIETKKAAVIEVHARLLAGEWNKRREGTGGGTGGLLYRALVRMYAGKKTADDIRTFLEGKTAAEQAALRKNSKVAAIIEEIRAEQARDDSGADSDALLGELDG